MRKLNHGVEGKKANLQVFATDERGPGGASHHYIISSEKGEICRKVDFQTGPIGEDGSNVNGIQHEDLLAIIIDRLISFQAGPYTCDENAVALHYCEKALEALNERTRKRIERGVEGTLKV